MVEENKQTQKAGDNSQQLQAGVINIYNGIDEKRAREICAETYEIAKKDFTDEAIECANSRVQKLEDTLMPKIMVIEGALNSFSNPSFQKLLRKAQIAAAASERENDYDLLSELLICRIEKGEKRKTRASISRAVEIIDEIDDDALCGLTTAFAILSYIPKSGYCSDGLNILEDLYNKLIYMDLPSGNDWLEHLDVLNAIRVGSFMRMNNMKDILIERLEGYVTPGIKRNSESYNEAINILSNVGMPASFLITHELNDDYVRLPLVNKDSVEKVMLFQSEGSTKIFKSSHLTQNQKDALYSIWNLYESDNKIKEQFVNAFIDEWDKHPCLNKIHLWWDQLSQYFVITQIGSVIAYTNAKRCDNTLPELPLSN